MALIVITALLAGNKQFPVENPPVPAVADTIYVLPANASVEDRPDTNPAQMPPEASKKKQSSEPKQDKSIDEIFEQASDLFEENL